MHPTWIEVDLQSLKNNISEIKKIIGKRLFLLPVKANAYGLGLCPVSKAAVEAGVDYLGVAFIQEAIDLRKSGIKIPILVLGPFLEEQIELMIHHDVEFTISSHLKANLVSKVCERLNKTCKVHLKVDTGMGRIGMRPDTCIKLYDKLKNHPYIKIKGLFSHLATSDQIDNPICLLQMKAFDLFVKTVDPENKLISHIANSAALERYQNELCLRQMVRPGILAFGCPHFEKYKEVIKPCFSLKSRVCFFKVVEKDFGISYGHTYLTKKQTRIVTIPVGYGDGYRRCLSNRARVLIRGKSYPVVGNICMDQCMVDIGDDEAYVGDEVVLVGKQGESEISLTELSVLLDSVPHELFSGFTSRIPRIYV